MSLEDVDEGFGDRADGFIHLADEYCRHIQNFKDQLCSK